jgi:hypothetical protein
MFSFVSGLFPTACPGDSPNVDTWKFTQLLLLPFPSSYFIFIVMSNSLCEFTKI